jgi:hypothetical protein
MPHGGYLSYPAGIRFYVPYSKTAAMALNTIQQFDAPRLAVELFSDLNGNLPLDGPPQRVERRPLFQRNDFYGRV